MLDREAVESQLLQGTERREFEVKGPGQPDGDFIAKVARAALGLANLQDGGYIVVGIDGDNLAAMQPGLTGDELDAWMDYDLVASRLCGFGDPPLSFSRASLTLTTGATVVVRQIEQFNTEPHLSARSNPSAKLHEGRLYVRSRRGAIATTEISSSLEMREVLDLALVKRLRDYLRIGEQSGLDLKSTERLIDRYNSQILPPTDLGNTIASRPHYSIQVRPADTFVAERINFSQLMSTLERAVVRMRGWPFPFVDDNNEAVARGNNWIGQDIDASDLGHVESWTFFQSGLFTGIWGVSAEWRHADEVASSTPDLNRTIEYWDVLFLLTEVFEFATRLALQLPTAIPVSVNFSVKELRPGTLLRTPPNSTGRISRHPAPTGPVTVLRTQNVSDADTGPAGLALDAAREIFSKFGWTPSMQELQVLQRNIDS